MPVWHLTAMPFLTGATIFSYLQLITQANGRAKDLDNSAVHHMSMYGQSKSSMSASDKLHSTNCVHVPFHLDER